MVSVREDFGLCMFIQEEKRAVNWEARFSDTKCLKHVSSASNLPFLQLKVPENPKPQALNPIPRLSSSSQPNPRP